MKEAFCGICMRTVYLGPNDDEGCPVCSSPLVVTKSRVAPPAEVPAPSRLVPADEELRLAAVNRYEILDTPPDGAFDRITDLASKIFEVPIATITIVDADRIWFKAKHGIEATEIGRDPGLCASAILEGSPWVVTDASVDPRTLDNPLVRGELGLRFYAGAQLTTGDGFNLGTLNIIDTHPREISDQNLEVLKQLSCVVVDELELRLAALRLFREAADKGVRLN
ncbi:MAG: phosphoserine phosphatase RsbU/P [Actinomycetota bacterium]|nr:phosphoserine phosphatase RsbU/P [Actinomycetota bacterium]